MLRFLTAGESHGQAQVAILEGIPAGLKLNISDIQKDLNKRRGRLGRGGRGLIESDQVKILSGVRFGKTIGSPIALLIKNQDFKNWKNKNESEVKVTNPRPGHADLAGSIKYGFKDIRNVLERASARETVMRVAVGAICRKFLAEFDIEIFSHTTQIGPIKSPVNLTRNNIISLLKNQDPETGCLDPKSAKKMKDLILQTTKNKDTLGGVIEIIALHVPAGLGNYVHYDRKLDAKLAHALMSIPSVKAVEIGDGINNAGKLGSGVQDEIFVEGSYPDQNPTLNRKTNRAGGIEGGVSNGENIIIRVFHKPLSTLGNPLKSVDIISKKPAKALQERSDVCVVQRAGVIAENMVAFVLTDCFLEKFGADSINDIQSNYKHYKKRIKL